MKALLIVLMSVVAMSAEARVKNYTGKVVKQGFTYQCVLRNNTEDTLDIKWAVFSAHRGFYDEQSFDVREYVNQRVRTGESLKVTTNSIQARYTVDSCHFLSHR